MFSGRFRLTEYLPVKGKATREKDIQKNKIIMWKITAQMCATDKIKFPSVV